LFRSSAGPLPSPHAACNRACCAIVQELHTARLCSRWDAPSRWRLVVRSGSSQHFFFQEVILHLQLTDLLEQLIALLLKEILLRILLCLEHRGSSFQELSLPGGDLVGMQVELLGQLAYCFALAERLYHHFSFERGGELASVSSAHRKGKLGYARSLSSFSRPPHCTRRYYHLGRHPNIGKGKW